MFLDHLLKRPHVGSIYYIKVRNILKNEITKINEFYLM